MSDNPIRAFRFIHTAIRREARAIASDAHTLNGPADAAKLATRVSDFYDTCHLHTTGEEKGLFPRIADKLPGNDRHYLFDHVEERELTKEVEGCARKIASGDDSPNARDLLKSKASALYHHLQLHMKKEEGIVLPIIEEYFPSPPDQGKIIGDVMSVYTPETLSKTLPWLINWLDPADRVMYLKKMSMMMPPPMFAAAKGWVKAGVPGDVWTQITTDAPDLAT